MSIAIVFYYCSVARHRIYTKCGGDGGVCVEKRNEKKKKTTKT